MPSTTDIRVHEQFGGTSRSVELTDEAAMLAAEAIATVVDLLGEEIVYGRVDMMRYQGRLVVSEVELTEPGLYLDVLPAQRAAVRRGGRRARPARPPGEADPSACTRRGRVLNMTLALSS